MRVGVVGAGPAGLYFALLLKKHHPEHEVSVIEQNPAGATYGWGVVFSDRATSYLEEADPDSYRDIAAALESWDDQVIVEHGQPVRIDGFGFSGVSRLRLLTILQDHCQRAGVSMQFDTRLTDLTALADFDLIVAADGANSVVRQAHQQEFATHIETLTNAYVWYGTHQLFEALSLIFHENADGAFVAHTYRYSPTLSTFIVECDAQTFARAGLAQMSDPESRAYCERVFAADLGGNELLSNKSDWLNFRVIRNDHWSYRNIVLIGDALRSVHFSIGSGTRMALTDAIALFQAFEATGQRQRAEDVPAALAAFEQARRPIVEEFLSVAARSYLWYEHFHEKLHLAPLPFAYDYMTRGGRVTHERLRERSPRFVAEYDAYIADHPDERAGQSA
ncbi:MAG TPA: FAD-dependent monooxygenase [Ktedonobacterales bacterium]|nr:FAD-dependent monooxygenase [Ktedonobacterales bacterium]